MNDFYDKERIVKSSKVSSKQMAANKAKIKSMIKNMTPQEKKELIRKLKNIQAQKNNKNFVLDNNHIHKNNSPSKSIKKDYVSNSELDRRIGEEIKRKSKKRKKRKFKFKKIIWGIIFIIGLVVLTISIINIFSWDKDNKNTKKMINDIEKIIKIEEVPEEEEKVEKVNPPENPDNDYWNYIKLPLIDVDFTELLKKNSDTVGFLKVNGTNINYPVVQSSDNDYYLTRSFDKSYNDAGWIFLDYRNDINNLQANTIIYGHSRLDTTMFGTLKNIFRNNWYANTDNYVINLSTTKENTLWQVFSVYSVPEEDYYLTTSFSSNEEHQKFVDTLVSRSRYEFNAEVNINDKILTLSTCYVNNERVVLHAKLIKRMVRE